MFDAPIDAVWNALDDELHLGELVPLSHVELVSGSACADGRKVLMVLPLPIISDRYRVNTNRYATKLAAESEGQLRELVRDSVADPSAEALSAQGRAAVDGLVLVLARTERRVVALLLPLLVLLPVFHAMAEQGIPREKAHLPCMGGIAAGVLTALAARHVPEDRVTGWALSIGGGALLLSVLGWGDSWWPKVKHATLTVHVLGASMALLGAWMLRGECPILALEPLRALGRLSYEVYLTHMFVVFAIVELWRLLGLGKAEGGWAYPLAILWSTVLGWLFARLWSEPCDRATRRRLLPTG